MAEKMAEQVAEKTRYPIPDTGKEVVEEIQPIPETIEKRHEPEPFSESVRDTLPPPIPTDKTENPTKE